MLQNIMKTTGDIPGSTPCRVSISNFKEDIAVL
jgi:chitinase